MKVARNEPQRYGKNGELLIDYEHPEHIRRTSVGAHVEKNEHRNVENVGGSFTGTTASDSGEMEQRMENGSNV